MTFIENSDKFERDQIRFFRCRNVNNISHGHSYNAPRFKLRARYLADAQKAVRPCDKRARKSTRTETPGPYVSPSSSSLNSLCFFPFVPIFNFGTRTRTTASKMHFITHCCYPYSRGGYSSRF